MIRAQPLKNIPRNSCSSDESMRVPLLGMKAWVSRVKARPKIPEARVSAPIIQALANSVSAGLQMQITPNTNSRMPVTASQILILFFI